MRFRTWPVNLGSDYRETLPAPCLISEERSTAETPNSSPVPSLPGHFTITRSTLSVAPNPIVTLNHAVAVAFARGPRAGLALLAPLDDDPRMATHHRLAAVRGHPFALDGEPDD